MSLTANELAQVAQACGYIRRSKVTVNNDMENKKRGFVAKIYFDELAEIMNLPLGARIEGVWSYANEPDVLHFRVVGIGPEIDRGNIMQEIKPASMKAVILDWDIPK